MSNLVTPTNTAGQAPRVIFHAAYRLRKNATSASGIRPVKMLQAFIDLGCEVTEVTGSHAERRAKIRALRREIRGGAKFDLVYSENSTAPIGLGEPVTRHTSLLRDTSFLKFCVDHGIPAGVFYRDIYWRFPIYSELVPWPLSFILRSLFRWDLHKYKRAGVTIYLPSLEMAKWVPTIPPDRFKALPPGSEVQTLEAKPHPRLRLLYVGGLSDNYRLHRTVRQIAQREDVQLVICTREEEWQLREAEYNLHGVENVQVVHRSGDELRQLYAEADVCLLAAEPIQYWSFAVPVKLFEYLGYGKPIVASENTYSGEFVRDNQLGWSVPYDDESLTKLLDRLTSHPAEIASVAERSRRVRNDHTWGKRAQQVIADLLQTQ